MPPVNEADIDWRETEHGEAHFLRKQLSAAAADGDDPDLGCSLYELPPGARSWPYHHHTGNAEAMYVLSGNGRLRLAGSEHSIEPGDYVPFPPDETGTHRVVNDSDADLRYLMFSTMHDPDVTVYPDSDKIGVFAGASPGSPDERTVHGYFRDGDDVDYWEGE